VVPIWEATTVTFAFISCAFATGKNTNNKKENKVILINENCMQRVVI
jgi:hypothetical protein